MNTKLRLIFNQVCLYLGFPFLSLLKSGGMRVAIHIIAALFILQSCNEKEEFEDLSHEVPVMENPGDSTIITEGTRERTGIIKEGYLWGVPITYEEIDGEAIFEGDILLSPEQLRQTGTSENERTSGAGNAAADNLWPNNTVYYTISRRILNSQRVRDAIHAWNVSSNLIFIESSSQPNRILFELSDDCSSSLGMIGGVQKINVGPGCTAGNIMHEIGHAVGLFHEHSRSDRDQYINVHWNNIKSASLGNFKKYNEGVNDKGIPYFMGFDHGNFDFGSIMMYPWNAFAINDSKPTISKKDGTSYTFQRDAPSAGDIAIVNDLYPKPFTKVNGPLAQDISVGADGTVYMVSKEYYFNTPTNMYGYHIFKWRGTSWEKEEGVGGIAVAVAPDGTPWVVTWMNEIYKKVGNTWELVPGKAKDIGIGADGTVWVISTDPVAGGYVVKRKNTSGWFPLKGSGGVAIDVTDDGNPWIITSDKQIYRKTPQGRQLTKVHGVGYEIACGGLNSSYILNGTGSNKAIFKWTGSRWLKQPGMGAKISAGPVNMLWMVKADGTVYQREMY